MGVSDGAGKLMVGTIYLHIKVLEAFRYLLMVLWYNFSCVWVVGVAVVWEVAFRSHSEVPSGETAGMLTKGKKV